MTNLLHQEEMDFRTEELVGKLSIPTIVSRQGSRIVYQLNLMFRQITSLFDHMPIKSSKEETEDLDLTALRNRFVRSEKVQEIIDYVTQNVDSYILPPISAVTDKLFSFQPYNAGEIRRLMGEEYDLVRNPHLISEVLDKFDGMLQGMLIVKEPEFNIEIMDGNHRCASIHRLTTLGREYKKMRIGVQIFFEEDTDRQKQAFVDLNTSTPIDKTLLTLFGNRDPLSIAAKETVGSNEDYMIPEFNKNSPHYIGFDMMNDSITRNSTATLSLNMVKNMLIKFALGESGTKKKFEKEFVPGTEKYDNLLKNFATYMKSVLENVPPFTKVKQLGVQSVPELRSEYVSLNAAGLYLIANIGHLANQKDKDLEELAKQLGNVDWKRMMETPGGEVVNPMFKSGLVNENKNISNNRSAHVATLTVFSNYLGLNN